MRGRGGKQSELNKLGGQYGFIAPTAFHTSGANCHPGIGILWHKCSDPAAQPAVGAERPSPGMGSDPIGHPDQCRNRLFDSHGRGNSGHLLRRLRRADPGDRLFSRHSRDAGNFYSWRQRRGLPAAETILGFDFTEQTGRLQVAIAPRLGTAQVRLVDMEDTLLLKSIGRQLKAYFRKNHGDFFLQTVLIYGASGIDALLLAAYQWSRFYL